jgi:Ca-activated chloride channel family protein
LRYYFASVSLLALALAFPQERVAITPRVRPERARATLRMDVRMVQIPVTVTDLRGAPVLGLPKTSFRVFENEIEQPITALSVSDAPVSAGIVFDSSRSMKPRLADSRAALDQFLETRGRQDEFLLVRFSDQPELLVPFTSNAADISSPLASVNARGWTALVDAICLATHQVRKGRHERKVLLVLTDGNDNNSRYSEAELVRLLREADVRVYAISLIERSRFLQKICEESGGRIIWVRRMGDLAAAMEELSRQIRSEYLVSYIPPDLQNDGRYHRVRVEVQPPEGMAKVYPAWRHGYLAPDE